MQNTVASQALWGHKESFIIAVSGGPDSLCLLDVLFLLSKKYPFELHIVHVNYGLRGRASDRDEALVRKQASAYGLGLTVFHPKKPRSGNLEEKLRILRYQFFEKVRLKKGATLIALAHHEDDQAETFLLRLLRGSGMRGLSAMRPRNGVLVRPLIEMSRTDILRYLKERGISFATDASNTDLQFLRNRLRHELLPLLEEKYQPRIKKILAQTASLLADDYAFFEEVSMFPTVRTQSTLSFSAKAASALPEVLLRHQLRSLLRPSFQGKFPPKSVVEEIVKIIRSQKSKPQQHTSRGLKLERKGDTVRLLDFTF